ncbi:MAG TPA: 1-phosphofructokinase family hexose kinase [Pontiella sp.]
MKNLSKPIICSGFTPCIQRILEFDVVRKGSVNRAKKITLGIGGKGANTARMIKQLGGIPVVVEFAGGANGKLLEQMLDEEGVAYRHVEVVGETRTCQTLIEPGNANSTELVEEMPPIEPADWERMIGLFESMSLSGHIVPVCGKLPIGAPPDAYAQLCRLVADKGGRVILDTFGIPLLKALESKPELVKINNTELLKSTGRDDPVLACGELMERGAQSVFITRGSRMSFYMDRSRILELFPPTIDAVNAIGSGDAVTAGIAVALNNGQDLEDALINGMACGAANALTLLSGYFHLEDVERLRSAIRMVAL